ncbi:MAG: hypothetical protein GQ525_02320 [Draconibacterium sp.]|nr:hypothetical protein [Draconibacterium sp.]
MKNLVPILIFFALLLCNCNKEVEEEEEELLQDLKFQSLVAEEDTLVSGAVTNVIATATGSNLNYYWSAFKGDILGFGSEIIYASSPCYLGKNQITCTVTNGNNQSETKTIDIVVIE